MAKAEVKRDALGRYIRGTSGNPAGRKRGSKRGGDKGVSKWAGELPSNGETLKIAIDADGAGSQVIVKIWHEKH